MPINLVYSSGATRPDAEGRETRAITMHCGEPFVTCAYPATGHQQYAAGPFNVGIAALLIANGVIPPTLHFQRSVNGAPTQLVTQQAVEADA